MSTKERIYADTLLEDINSMYPLWGVIYLCGCRGCGKTYFAKKFILDNFINLKKGFIYVGRYKDDLSTTLLEGFFSDIEWKYTETLATELGMIKPKIHYYAKKWTIRDEESDAEPVPLGIAVSVKDAEKFKRGVVHTFYDIILFDEVITDTGYWRGDREPQFFQKIVETVGRSGNTNLKVILTGNLDSDVESCPYLTKYTTSGWSYDQMKDNSCVTFDTKDMVSGEIIKDNVIFVKLAKKATGKDDAFLNTTFSGVFSVAESRMAYDGKIKHSDYNVVHPAQWSEKVDFKPVITIKQETAVKIGGTHPKHIYCTIGVTPTSGEGAVILIHRHDIFNCSKIIGRYEHLGQDIGDSIYKGNLSLYPKLAKLYNRAVLTMNVYVENEQTAQTFFNIVKDGKMLPYTIQ